MGTNKGDYMKSGRDYSSIRSALDARARITPVRQETAASGYLESNYPRSS